ncbi:MAG: molybdenum cofactor biosynthesis protein MoaE [Candidatus Hydrothermarchaeota archaeon]|nr:MAG: molybdenum cofactor biosynthesis protein MoaE [Candidatus Hydrothermarchaeota archaeon]
MRPSNDFSIDKEIEDIKLKDKNNEIGAIVSLLGIAKAVSKDGKPVEKVYFPPFEKSEEEIEKIKKEAIERFNVKEIRIFHKLGEIKAGESIALVIVAAKYRKEAFEACQYCINKIKNVFLLEEIYKGKA